MRKDLDLKLSWYSKENWDKLIEDGYLPLLAIKNPETHGGTPIHFPKIAPRFKDLSVQEFKEYLYSKITIWKILNTFDVLSHLASSKGVVLLTDQECDPYREVLGEFFSKYLNRDVTEYKYRDESN